MSEKLKTLGCLHTTETDGASGYTTTVHGVLPVRLPSVLKIRDRHSVGHTHAFTLFGKWLRETQRNSMVTVPVKMAKTKQLNFWLVRKVTIPSVGHQRAVSHYFEKNASSPSTSSTFLCLVVILLRFLSSFDSIYFLTLT